MCGELTTVLTPKHTHFDLTKQISDQRFQLYKNTGKRGNEFTNKIVTKYIGNKCTFRKHIQML